jgi:AraC-like DNA-binding protein
MNTLPKYITHQSRRTISYNFKPQTQYQGSEKDTYTPVINLYPRQVLPQSQSFNMNGQPGGQPPECQPPVNPNARFKPDLGLHSFFVERVIRYIEQHLDEEDYGIRQVCQDVGISRSRLHIKLKALTGYSTSIFIRLIRLQKARALLLSTDLNITQVAFEVGFRDALYFSRVFSQTFQQSPKAYREHALMEHYIFN